MDLLSWETLTSEERRRHPAYREGYVLFKGKPKDFSAYGPYLNKEHEYARSIEHQLWSRGANAALEEDRGPNYSWKGHDGPPLEAEASFEQLNLFD